MATVTNPIDQQIINVTRTCYASYLQTVKYLGLSPFTVIDHTTLNEKFGIQAGIAPATGEVPNVRYMVIGNQGHYTVTASDGSDEVVNVIHASSDAALYNHIPFALREVANDLSTTIRDNFCLRRIETWNSKTYVAWYGYRLSVTGVQPSLQQMETINGVITVTPFVPTADNLNPTRPTISNSGTVVGSNKSIYASAIITVNLTADMITEITSAHQIRTASTRSPIISEIGLCSGVDRTVTGTGAAATITYKEVIAAQINVFIATNHPVGYSSAGLTLSFEIGGVEPTLGSDAVNQATYA